MIQISVWDEKQTGWINGSFNIAEEKICELEDIAMETIQNKTQREEWLKQMKRASVKHGT